ncbi:SYF2-domain-containing protein [Aulographum hederae CBS 113979]|uniref:Pre-mRNA-splicing factor SYF2 n=1 Tax=Aulographum hederae CBS 113979 TaxID=1176131 RepID=A0A6G1GUL3_9PEZI|nr:SYF2-domain-containing protein [Aulographum hederae CBS 113979]
MEQPDDLNPPAPVETAPTTKIMDEAEPSTNAPAEAPAEATASTVTPSDDRLARFAALQARKMQSRKDNLKETAAEQKRLSTDPNLLTSLARKRDLAQHKLLKAEAGDEFERKRAWDWTVDESEKWDRRLEKKARQREDVAFQDYRQDARKIYKRQLRNMEPDLEKYQREKMEAVEKAAASGGLEVVETEDGELIAVDRDGSFYSTAESTENFKNRPDKKAVDRLVEDIRKAEEVRLKKRKDRGKDDDGDVTYINAKNKAFNEKLKRFYDKYTVNIRENFERGTAM